MATKANQVWSWDISYLPSPVRGLYHYLYLVEDIYSRIVWGGKCMTARRVNGPQN